MRIECSYSSLELVENLKEFPANRNKHSEKQIKALAKIIAKVGQRSPIVVSNQSGYIVKGHGRAAAIKALGWEKCAVDYQDYKTELEEFNDRIADNEIARYAEFDLSGFKTDLDELDLDLSIIDFEEFGLIDFSMQIIPEQRLDDDDMPKDDSGKKWLLEIELPNELELRDLNDDLLSKGYIVRQK